MNAADDVVRAWLDAGPRPDYHFAMRSRVRESWPALASAIERLVSERINDETPAPIPQGDQGGGASAPRGGEARS